MDFTKINLDPSHPSVSKDNGEPIAVIMKSQRKQNEFTSIPLFCLDAEGKARLPQSDNPPAYPESKFIDNQKTSFMETVGKSLSFLYEIRVGNYVGIAGSGKPIMPGNANEFVAASQK